MADEILDPVAGKTPADPPGGPGSSAVSEPRIDAARYEQLEAYYARTNPILEQYQDDFNAIVSDEKYREFQRTSRESYYDMQKRLKADEEAAIPESEKRLLSALDERFGKFKPVLDDYESRAEAQTRSAKEASEKFTRENLEYAQRLVAEQQLTPEEVGDLGRFAKVLHDESVAQGSPRFVGLEEAYKRLHGRAETKAAATTPRSLRAKAGATGVPGVSKAPASRDDVTKPGGLTRHVLGVLNNQRKTG